MDKNIENLLNNLEPDIDKKCFEIKEMRKEKQMQRIFILFAVLILFVPSILILLNISVFGIIFGAIAIIAVLIIAMMPIALKQNIGGECYE